MGKLLNSLQKQLKTEFKQDAEDCLKIYNYLKDTTGHVWESSWNLLVTTTFEGFQSGKRISKLTVLGSVVLKGLNTKEDEITNSTI